VPIIVVPTVLPRFKFFRELSIAPASIRSMIPSVRSPEWIPKCLFPFSAASRKCEILPIPNWIVAPSGIKVAIKFPICFSASLRLPVTVSGRQRSVSMA